MIHLDLFSGIGGFALAAERVWPDIKHIFCDNDPFCQQVLKKHWPKSKIFGDIRTLHYDREKGMFEVWREDTMASAHDAVKKIKQEKAEDIVSGVMLNTLPNGRRIRQGTLSLSAIGEEKTKKTFSDITEENAFVAGRAEQSFSPSTTSKGMEIKSVGNTEERELGKSQKKESSQPTTKSSATTATTRSIITENVHIKTQIDTLSAGVPCQPASQAGKRRGRDDNRWLWPDTLRVIRETQPRWVILENVYGFITLEKGLAFDEVLSELENQNYETRTFIVPACAVNAPHRRDRVWIVAHSNIGQGRPRNESESRKEAYVQFGAKDTDAPDTGDKGYKGGKSSAPFQTREKKPHGSITQRHRSPQWNQNWLEVATRLCRVDDGLPRKMDRNPRLKALGNAIVPQVAEEIMKGIKLAEKRLAQQVML